MQGAFLRGEARSRGLFLQRSRESGVCPIRTTGACRVHASRIVRVVPPRRSAKKGRGQSAGSEEEALRTCIPASAFTARSSAAAASAAFAASAADAACPRRCKAVDLPSANFDKLTDRGED